MERSLNRGVNMRRISATSRIRVPRVAVGSLLPTLTLALIACGLLLGSVARGEDARDTTAYQIRVLTRDAKPAAGAVVRVRHADEEMPQRLTDGDGRVRVEGFKPGEPAVFLITSAEGQDRAFEPVFVVPEGDQYLPLRLYPPRRAWGHVFDGSGEPAGGALVQLTTWEWLGEPDRTTKTDEQGQFEFDGLIPGAYYRVVAYQGHITEPTVTWRSEPFRVYGPDGERYVGLLLPEGKELCLPKPPGEVVRTILSGIEDETFDVDARAWVPAVVTYDPNRGWCPGPLGSSWIWRAGRPDATSEKLGATVEFRRIFTVDRPTENLVGYMRISADDYALVRVNGKWVGHCNQYQRWVDLVIDPEQLRPGENELRVTLRNTPGSGRDYYNPTGLAYSLELIELEQ